MNCPKCNAQINDRFCPECGYDTSNKKQCPVCQGEMAGRFCEKCGYDSEKNTEPKKKESVFGKAKVWMKSHKGICIAGMVAIMLVVGLIPVIAYFSSIYRVGVVSQVTVGMEKVQVEAILGTPTERRDYKWVYFNSDALSELEELDAEMEEAFLSGDDEKLMELAEEYDRKSTELESETFEYIEIYFDSEGKVESVLLDTEKSYADEVEPKVAEEADVEVEEIEGFRKIENGKETFLLSGNLPSAVIYWVEYEDGSYYSGRISGKNVKVKSESGAARLTWLDYSGEVECSVTKTNITNVGDIENGVLKWYYGSGGDLIIPDSVTSIGAQVFDNCLSLTSVTIPNSVTSIGSYAFSNCESLTSITIPNSVTSIGENAFRGCTSLKYNEYDNGYYIGNEENPYLVLIKAKDTSITSCEINKNTRFIHHGAFYNCTSLTSVTIPESVTSIGTVAFTGCTSLEYNKYGEGYYIGNEGNPYLVLIKASNSSCEINENTRFIHSNAFYNCYYLTSITIPESVTSIGAGAFSNCTSLKSVTIGESVTSIGDGAFSCCTELKYNEYDNGYYIGNEENPYLVLVKTKDTSITSCEINENTRFINSSAFSNCGSLTNVTFENTKGWKVDEEIIDVTDPSKNAENLTLNHEGCSWTREQ